MQRDVMSYDVLIVGAGPAGLAAAIRLKQLAAASGEELSVCVLEKGAQIGAHILSGAIIDPVAVNELIPDWRMRGAPLRTPVSEELFLLLGERTQRRVPHRLLPPMMRNEGHYVGSLGELCQWLAQEAEALGVEIYCGFAAARALYTDDGRFMGVITGDVGVLRDGTPGPNFAPGMELHARYTLIAEGTRGSLAAELERRFDLRAAAQPQKYGIGFKELWRVDAARHRPGLILHSQGWPLEANAGGGGFVYHYGDGLVSVGLIVHLDYRNPHLDPYEEFQRYKTHPAIRAYLEGGTRLGYGARAINSGGTQSLPRLVFPGGALIGCAAGFVNLPRIKGSHNAVKTGMLAAQAVITAMQTGRSRDVLEEYPAALRKSWVWRELDQVRNVKPTISKLGTRLGSIYAGAELWLACFGVRLPWTLRHARADHESLREAAASERFIYPAPDGVVSFNKLSSVQLANVAHEEDQPVHLRLRDAAIPTVVNLPRYDAPEQRYCPAGVYEIVRGEQGARLQINAANCIHCKTCDIKDPLQNIVWTTPEGGGGPNYQGM